jgi:hypothetical protein
MSNNVPLTPRHGTDRCAKCRKPFKKGDRVTMIFIIQSTGFNPTTREVGSWLGEEFELAHAMCEDTSLSGTLIIPGGG